METDFVWTQNINFYGKIKFQKNNNIWTYFINWITKMSLTYDIHSCLHLTCSFIHRTIVFYKILEELCARLHASPFDACRIIQWRRGRNWRRDEMCLCSYDYGSLLGYRGSSFRSNIADSNGWFSTSGNNVHGN